MFRLGVLMMFLGFGSLLIRGTGRQFILMVLFEPAQPYAGILVGIMGAGILVLSFTSQRRASRHDDNTREWFANQQRLSQQMRVEAASYPPQTPPTRQFDAPVVQPMMTQPFNPAPPPAVAPLPVTDMTAFHQAVSLAQAGNSGEAYGRLKNLLARNPSDVNLLLWTAFTSPDRAEATHLINQAQALEPYNPAVAQAQTWLRTTAR